MIYNLGLFSDSYQCFTSLGASDSVFPLLAILPLPGGKRNGREDGKDHSEDSDVLYSPHHQIHPSFCKFHPENELLITFHVYGII